MVSLLFPPLNSWACGSSLFEKQNHILGADSEYTAFQRTFSCPARYCFLAGTVFEFSKGHSIILLNQLLQDGGKHGKTSKVHEHELIATLFCCEVNSLIRSDTVWNTVKVNKDSINPQMVVLAEALCTGRQIHIQHRYLCQLEQIAAPSMTEVVQCNHPSTR